MMSKPINNMPTEEVRASIFTLEQAEELRRLKSYFPFRIVWGEVVPDTQKFTAYASSDRRALNKSVRKGNLVATVGGQVGSATQGNFV